MDVLLIYGRFSDVHAGVRFARGEVYVQRSGPRSPLQGDGVGGTYSSGEQLVPSVRSPTHSLSHSPTHAYTLPHASL